MQIKEFEALTLKECLQQVRGEMGPDAVILETRKIRKGGLMGMGGHDAVAIVAATGVTVDADTAHERPRQQQEILQPGDIATGRDADLVSAGNRLDRQNGGYPAADAMLQTPGRTDRDARAAAPQSGADRRLGNYGTRNETDSASIARRGMDGSLYRAARASIADDGSATASVRPAPARSAARIAARGVYGAQIRDRGDRLPEAVESTSNTRANTAAASPAERSSTDVTPTIPYKYAVGDPSDESLPAEGASVTARPTRTFAVAAPEEGGVQLAYLERAMGEIRDRLAALQREQQEGQERTVTAVTTAAAHAITTVAGAAIPEAADEDTPKFSELEQQLRDSGVSDALTAELMDLLPDMGAWSEQAQAALAISAMKDLISRRVAVSGPIQLEPGRTKVVALIGPTGVGKTTTIAKLAASFALIHAKRVALVTVDTYRIAAVDQLKTYSQIIGLPVKVAYNASELPEILRSYAGYDLVLIDTAGRSPQHGVQISELKSLLESLECESHLVLAATMKERDMADAIKRFSAAGIDRIIFSKLDETTTFGTLLNVAQGVGVPLSYLTTGQKVPEDLETAESRKFAELILK